MKIGLLAGEGLLPFAFAENAKAMGHSVVAIQIFAARPELASHVDKLLQIPVGQWGKILSTLQQEAVDRVYMVGKVPKGLMYTSMEFDARFRQIMGSLAARNDDAVVLAFIADLAAHGLEVGSQLDILEPLLVRPGVLTDQAPTPEQWQDIGFGFPMAKGIGRLDIGRTVVVKHAAVVAAEAVEGTDEAILRGGALAGPGTVVVKVAKPHQDLRFDIPTVGERTLQYMVRAQASVLAVEAGAVLIVEEPQFVRQANELGIAIVGVSDQDGQAGADQ